MVLWRMLSGSSANAATTRIEAQDAQRLQSNAKEDPKAANAADGEWDDEWVDLGGSKAVSKDAALESDYLFEGSTASEASGGKSDRGESSDAIRARGETSSLDTAELLLTPPQKPANDEFVDLEVARPLEEAAASVATSDRDDIAESTDDADPTVGQAEDASDQVESVSSRHVEESNPDGEEEDDEDANAVLQCQTCHRPILKASEIISASYRAMTGPGYLTGAARNVVFSEETQEAQYTSGRYTVKEVSCEGCNTSLGITYVGAAVFWNKHKVGKFLLGQDLLKKVNAKQGRSC
eukprot:TRINITY_DN17059_c0_g1_i1.p1 TRINITY_DN17059_c0_g1~~TRINITY_DN17059_c0_g1_i1.p1  ORF type:complete len:295 (-),score=81.85 TRINITY_DN17059_c0_g1_i1:93-977(-)